MNRANWVEAVGAMMIAAAVLMFVWGATGGPMLRNYAKCGTIFLCSAQP